MEAQRRRSLRAWLVDAYWLVVGIVALGRPIVDRRAMYGDERSNDPYSIDFEPVRSRHRVSRD